MKNFNKLLISSFLILTVCLLVPKISSAALYSFNLTYSGANEVPPNISPATGTIVGTYNDVTNTISFTINFSGLLANTTAAHFHCCAAAGANAPVIINYAPGGFPLGVTSGTWSNSYVLTAAQEVSLIAGTIYSNIHTSQFPGGEIRAQMIVQCANPGIPSIVLSNGTITVGGVTQPYPLGCGTTIIEPCDPNNPWSIEFDAIITDPGDVLAIRAVLPDPACNVITFTPALPFTGPSPVTIHCKIAAICPPNPNCLHQLFQIIADDQCNPPNTGICSVLLDKPLPVELSSFLASVKENDVTLNWVTASEENNSRFEIERSNLINGNTSEWKTVGTVQGSGNSSTPKSYSLADMNLNAGSYNYRLKQIDFNGNFQYHNLNNEVVVGIPTRFDLLQNYPNPFNPTTNIAYILPIDGNVKLNIYSSNGELVSTINEGFRTAGYYAIEFNASSLASGVYYYRIDFGSGEKSFVKVMKMVVLK